MTANQKYIVSKIGSYFLINMFLEEGWLELGPKEDAYVF